VLGVVADDLTGAGDASVQFAKRGWYTLLTLQVGPEVRLKRDATDGLGVRLKPDTTDTAATNITPTETTSTDPAPTDTAMADTSSIDPASTDTTTTSTTTTRTYIDNATPTSVVSGFSRTVIALAGP
jgi:hypothetical protein